MRIGLIQVFAVMLPSGRFAASSPPRGEPDIVHELRRRILEALPR